MKKLSLKELLLAILIGLVGFMSTYYLAYKVQTKLISQEYVKLDNIAKQVSIRFQDAVDISLNDLQALQAFYSAKQQNSSLSEFEHYMSIVDINHRHYIQALSWVPLVHNSQREQFEADLRLEQSDFMIKERGESGSLVASKTKTYYTPVTYISPYKINKAAQGFDLSSNKTRRVSLCLARDRGEMTATAKIRLVQEQGDSYGFLLIAPVYKKDVPLLTVEARKNALRGYVTGVFRIDTLMESAREQADETGLELRLLDIEKDETSLLYGLEGEGADFLYDIVIPDRRWQLNLSLSSELKNSINSPPIVNWIRIGGFLISFLLALSFYALQVSINRSRHIGHLSLQLQDKNRELESTVAERTKSLSLKNRELNQHVAALEEKRITLSRLMDESQLAKTNAEKLAKELARSNNDLDEFAYVASHDLKAPLRGIIQLTGWIVEDLEENNVSEISKKLTMIQSRANRLEALLNDLLEYSRFNKQDATLVTLDCKKLVEELFPLYSPLEGFALVIHGELPVFKTLGAPLEQVIRNLLNNAFKHHDKDKGEIEIKCDDEGEFYRFMIKDDGPGIDEHHYEDIFKMFKTLKSRDEVEGSGMGLALIKKIVEFYNGQVYVESTLNEGCAFFFTWPKRISNQDN